MKNLTKYLKQNKIRFNQLSDIVIEVNSIKLELLLPTDGLLFDDQFNLICKQTENNGYVYKFGGKYYYDLKQDIEHPKLKPLKYLGKAKEQIKTKSFLGVRGGFELLNGSRLYKDWCAKAKFLGVTTLGLCEKNTLAGALKFQLECIDNDIDPVIGMTVTVLRPAIDLRYDVKCYVETNQGWENLLLINKELNVVNYKFIKEEDFLKLTEGLSIVVDPKSLRYDDIFPLDMGNDLYYQLDTVEYESNDRDKEYLLNLKQYIKSDLKPVAITDAFYLDREESYVKQILNQISNVREYKAVNQYFKSKEDYFYELDMLFNPDSDELEKVFNEAVKNEQEIVKRCKFVIETGKRHLPRYEMTEEQKAKFEDNEDLFWFLIEEGLKRKCPKDDIKQYIERVETEVDVIKQGDVIDYFLILWDIIKWSQENDILVGIGRGSGGGSLVAYLLDLTQIDPIEYDLLFERFLNVGRIKKSLPDLDTDFQGDRRDEVKRYMEHRFGELQVCSIGTYTTLKLKAAIKDLSRQRNVDFSEANYVTTVLQTEKDAFADIFENACKRSRIKKFVQDNSDVINDLPLILHQPKSSSIHACATLILPKEKDIFRWIPVKKMSLGDGEEMLISEWEGGELDSAGFLKEDILGIKQLTKFKDTLDSIKEHSREKVDIYNLPKDDVEVYRYFSKGWNADVFHFGSSGLTGYCKQLKPDNMEDLIAGISLYRPGAMENNFHNEYVLRKDGEREVEYLWGCEKATEKTLGLVIYQETVMKICAEVGGFSLVESDDVRKAMGKKKKDVLDKYKQQFTEGAIKKGCPENEAIDLWEKLEKFASYGFNRSHAAAYSITGYICQWLKVHYPIHYWTTAFKFCKEEDIPNYINEINKTGDIKIMPPDINKSYTSVYTDFSKNTIYWALSSIKQVGETSTDQIIEERNKNGQYFSLDEFLERHTFKGSKVNKRVIENLILSGAFDDVEAVQFPSDRLGLITQYRKRNKVKQDEEKDVLSSPNTNKSWWWNYQQKLLSGIAFFDYEELCVEVNKPYFDPDTFNDEDSLKSNCVIAGYVVECNIRDSKKGRMAKIILENNYSMMNVLIWAEQFDRFQEQIEGCDKTIMIISGVIQFDGRNNCNTLQTTGDTYINCLK